MNTLRAIQEYFRNDLYALNNYGMHFVFLHVAKLDCYSIKCCSNMRISNYYKSMIKNQYED